MDVAVEDPVEGMVRLNKSLAALVRRSRVEQWQFALKARVSQATVNNIVRGNRTWISIKTVYGFCEAAGLSDEQIGKMLRKAFTPRKKR